MKEKLDFWKILLSLTVFTFPVVFLLRFIFSSAFKKVLTEMPGDDNRWQWNEIWEGARLFIAVGSWGVMVSMVFLISVFDRKYPIELWITLMIFTAGSNGTEALIIYLKSKYGK